MVPLAEKGNPLRPSPSAFAAIANRSARRRARERPRGYPPVFRTGCGGGGTDSTRQRSARRPSATGPSHFRARCGAWPAKARCGASGGRAEWWPRRSRDPRPQSPAGAAVARVHRAAVGSHPPTRGLPASRSGSRRSGEPRAAHPDHHRSNGACSRAWPDQ
jgi:hypothetical protein